MKAVTAAAKTRVEGVTAKLREMIVSRELAPGSRVPERDLAETLGVSRTPVRVALGILAAEGLVRGEPNRGFVVCEFSIEHTLSTFDVRGALEGLAARTAAERGLDRDERESLQQCVSEGAEIISAGTYDAGDLHRWAQMNERFHRTIIRAARLSALDQVHEFMSRLPMVAPAALLFTNDERADAIVRIRFAQHDHEQILDALTKRQGRRVDGLVHEHTYMARQDLARLLSGGTLPSVLDGALVFDRN